MTPHDPIRSLRETFTVDLSDSYKRTSHRYRFATDALADLFRASGGSFEKTAQVLQTVIDRSPDVLSDLNRTDEEDLTFSERLSGISYPSISTQRECLDRHLREVTRLLALSGGDLEYFTDSYRWKVDASEIVRDYSGL